MCRKEDLQVLGEGRHIRLVARSGWEYAARRGSSGVVAVVAVTDTGRLVLAEQYRPPVKARVIELPAGLVGDDPGARGESLVAGAQRELREETGYEARRWELIAEGPSSAGLADEILTVYRASGLTKVGPGGGDANEDIVVHEVALAEALDWLEDQKKRGALVDLKVYSGLYFAQRGAG